MTAAQAITSLKMTKFIKAPRQKVYEAWIRPEVLKRWMGPHDVTVPQAASDPKIGGRYRIVMESNGTGQMQAAGTQFIVGGKYQELVPFEKLVLTWQWEGQGTGETLITIHLKEKEGGTEMTLIHERFDDGEMMKRHEHGWTGSFQKLAAALEG